MVVAVVGLGAMGRAMAERLLSRGYELRVWNRTRARTQGLAAPVCESPADAARGAEVVMTSLSDDDAVSEVLLGERGLLQGLDDGAVHVGTSTISHALATTLVRIHAEHRRPYLSAPVVGRPEAAANGQLVMLAGGEESLHECCRPLFDDLARRVVRFSNAPTANLAKIVVNTMIGGTIELLGEVMALGEKGGIAPSDTVDLLIGTLFDCPAVATYGRRIAAEQFEPAGFRLALGLKDLELALSAGDELRAPLPAANVVRDHLLAAMATGREDIDWSGLTTVVRAEAGLSDGERQAVKRP
jgi:3-hydroxyisobutyrate dehydrogenase-like beta-hydroxyacid dehydrogenase